MKFLGVQRPTLVEEGNGQKPHLHFSVYLRHGTFIYLCNSGRLIENECVKLYLLLRSKVNV